MAYDSDHALLCGCPACAGTLEPRAEVDTLVAGGSSEPAALPVSQAPTYAINGVVNEYHYQWGSYTPGTATTVTYSFLTSVPGYYAANAGERNQFAAMNATQKQVTRDTFALFAEAANITFVEVAPGTASINLATANLGAGIGGWAYYPYPGYSGPGDQTVMGDVWITNRYASYSNPTKGSWEYLTIIHEIGHAIGLKHPGNYNAGGGGTGGPYLPTSEDSHQYTVMSYYSGPSYGSTEPITPQLYDIAAVQHLYGVNSATRSGNDTYAFATSLQIKTIWDGGGTDTFDLSNQTQAVVLDLRPGRFSSIAGSNNIAIAFGAWIENAIGSAFADTITGNDAGGTLDGRAGNDTLTGGSAADRLIGGTGTDVLTGNGGADIFQFATGHSTAATGTHDRVTDFTTGTDLIDLAGIDADVSTGVIDAFRFIGTNVFDGLAGALDYVFDAGRNVTVVQGDVNGDKAADFAIDFNGNLVLTSANFTAASIRLIEPLNLVGTAGPDALTGASLGDTLSGLDGDDTLSGLDGNDRLNGGTGADAMSGGTGDDTYVVDNAGDTITEPTSFVLPAGWTLRGTADFNNDGRLDVVVTNSAVGEIWLLNGSTVTSTHSFPGSGTDGWADWYIAGIADLDGDGDKDLIYQHTTLTAQWQNAIYLNGVVQTGGGGISYRVADPLLPLPVVNGGTDTVEASISYILPEVADNLTLVSGAGPVDGTGNAGANVIVGNESANRIAGNEGADILTGGGGADTFAYGDGDSVIAYAERDLITDFTPGTDWLDLFWVDADINQTGNQDFRFLGTAGFDGQAAALRISYDAARNVTVVEADVNGDGAADFAIDLTGNKSLAASDFASGSLLAPVNLDGTAADDTLAGNGMDNAIYGRGGSDTLSGEGGDDLLNGGPSSDALHGGEGDDTLIGGPGSDLLDGGNGIDTASYAGSTGPVSVSLMSGLSSGGHAPGDVMVDIESLSGSAYGDVLTGNDGANVISGGAGDDLLEGLNGDDTLNGGDGVDTVSYAHAGAGVAIDMADSGPQDTGGAGIDALSRLENIVGSSYADTLYGSNGDNVMSGGAGNDLIKGFKGVDVLTGGLGNDRLFGGAGSDTFVFAIDANNGGKDSIRDYVAGEDHIDLSGISTVANYAALHGLMSVSGADVLINFGGGHSVTIWNTTIATLDAHQADFQF
jgi:serralysin